MAVFDLSDDDRNALVRVIQQSIGLQTQTDVFLWLHGELQRFVPHDTLVIAWGDFASGMIHVDLISALPGVRAENIHGYCLTSLVRRLFNNWNQYGCKPLVVEAMQGFHPPEGSAQCLPTRSLASMRSAVIHGIKDQRGGQDCVYLVFSKSAVRDATNARSMIEVLIPYIDNSLRWVSQFPEQKNWMPDAAAEPAEDVFAWEDLGLSSREVEIMDWVRQGKTNQEIGMILSISVFTVKNHLQRVFKKLNVLNRAQAVARTSYPMRDQRA